MRNTQNGAETNIHRKERKLNPHLKPTDAIANGSQIWT